MMFASEVTIFLVLCLTKLSKVSSIVKNVAHDKCAVPDFYSHPITANKLLSHDFVKRQPIEISAHIFFTSAEE